MERWEDIGSAAVTPGFRSPGPHTRMPREHAEYDSQYCDSDAGGTCSLDPRSSTQCLWRIGYRANRGITGTRSRDRGAKRTFCRRVGDRIPYPISGPFWAGPDASGLLCCVQPGVDRDLGLFCPADPIWRQASSICSLVSGTGWNAQRSCAPVARGPCGILFPGLDQFATHRCRWTISLAAPSPGILNRHSVSQTRP